MSDLLCSIIVSSYNKAEYVGLAVESALSQTYGNTEVIVVDDGSSDNSVTVLERYRDRVTLITKANGGQASAMNRGFLVSHGDIVLFLDCDDLLDADTVSRVAEVWTPAISKVHFRLRKIRGDGSRIVGELLPPYRPLPSGDVSGTFRRFGLYPAPPTSGNAYARRVLDAVMPLPEAAYRAWPDTVLIGAAPLFGEVGALEGVGGCWRQTEGNYSNGGLEKVEAKAASERLYIEIVRRVSKEPLPPSFAARWPHHLKGELILAKFSTAAQPAGQLAKVSMAYLWAILRWPEYTWRERSKFGAWGLAMMLVPRALLRRVPGATGPNINLA